jgi:hypothetical protein
MGATGDQGEQTQGEDEQGKKKKARPPKPEKVLAREKATGIQAEWDESDNGGRGGWVIPGLSQKMGGPKGAKAGQQVAQKVDSKDDQGQGFTDKEKGDMKEAEPNLDNATKDFLRGGDQDAFDKLQKMEKSDPTIKNDPKYRKLRKHVEIALGMAT